MIKCYLLFFVFFCSLTASAAEPVQTLVSPSADLVWHKWDTENFIVLSIDKSQGVYLKNNIEKFKSSFARKWALQETKFQIPCKVLCVPDEQLLSRLFNVDGPRTEVRNENETIIWSDFDNFGNQMPFLMASVCLENTNCSFILKRGIPRLERSLDLIKNDFSKSFDIDSKSLFSTTEDSWTSSKIEEREKFDVSCALFCLLIRKELGIKKFEEFVNSSQNEESFRSIYGFKSLDDFSSTLNRYYQNLSDDISKNKTPDKYLQCN